MTGHSFHGIHSLPKKRESVTYVSGTICYLCVRSLIFKINMLKGSQFLGSLLFCSTMRELCGFSLHPCWHGYNFRFLSRALEMVLRALRGCAQIRFAHDV